MATLNGLNSSDSSSNISERKINKTKAFTTLVWSSVLLALTACWGGSDDEEAPANILPLVQSDTITLALAEGSIKNINLLDNVTDANTTDVLNVVDVTMVDGSPLPEWITFDNVELTVDASSINAADWENIVYDLTVTVTDWTDDVSYTLNTVIQDEANDSLMTFTNDIPTQVIRTEKLDGSVTLIDADNWSEAGTFDNSYAFSLNVNYVDENDQWTVVYNGQMENVDADLDWEWDVDADGNPIYTWSVDLANENINANDHKFVSIVSPIVLGENPQADVVITSNIQVLDPDSPLLISAPILIDATETTISVIVSDFGDSDGIRNVTVWLYSDEALTIKVAEDENGNFTWLTAATTYYVAREWEHMNGTTKEYVYAKSLPLEVTTDIEKLAPTDIKINGVNSVSINENTVAGSVIWTLSSVDSDSTTHTYSLVVWAWDDDNGLFTISWNDIIINYTPDFENPSDANGNNINDLLIRSTDADWKTFEKHFPITINDVVETVPDTEAPVLSSTTQTFTTTVWTPLTIETVTATDNEDTVVTVTQTWTVDFNTVWSYDITYSSTDTALNNSTIVHTYEVNEVPNTVPTWESFSIDAWFLNTAFVDLSSYLTDIDWDTVTATMVWSWVIWWDINISDANITWNVVSMTVDSWFWNWYIDYQVNDWTDTNSTIYRITIIDLDWN